MLSWCLSRDLEADAQLLWDREGSRQMLSSRLSMRPLGRSWARLELHGFELRHLLCAYGAWRLSLSGCSKEAPRQRFTLYIAVRPLCRHSAPVVCETSWWLSSCACYEASCSLSSLCPVSYKIDYQLKPRYTMYDPSIFCSNKFLNYLNVNLYMYI